MQHNKSYGVELIEAERQRQITEEGYTAEHDEGHSDGSLALAAACYAANEPIYVKRDFARGPAFQDPWPWEDAADRRKDGGNFVDRLPMTGQDRLRMLVKAGALIAAEIDSMGK